MWHEWSYSNAQRLLRREVRVCRLGDVSRTSLCGWVSEPWSSKASRSSRPNAISFRHLLFREERVLIFKSLLVPPALMTFPCLTRTATTALGSLVSVSVDEFDGQRSFLWARVKFMALQLQSRSLFSSDSVAAGLSADCSPSFGNSVKIITSSGSFVVRFLRTYLSA